MQRWARWVVKSRWVWIIAWPVAGLGIWLPAPRLSNLLSDDPIGFLPEDMPSQQAFARLREEFPNHAPASRAAALFVRESGLTEADQTLISAAAADLSARNDAMQWHVQAAALTPHLRPLLESPDGQAAIIVVSLPAELLTHHSVNRVREVKRVLASHAPPAGLQIEVTGSAALGELLDANAKRDVDHTTIWAFLAVAVILLLIYRSPVAMLLPLVTIALSLLAAMGIIGWAASVWLPINGLVEMFIIVIVVGSGVDYCLFLFARFREEMAHHPDVSAAIESAVSRSGGAIVASGATNAAGLATLMLGANRDLYTSGPTIAFAICVATFAVLTLTPALMLLAGRRLLWPGKLQLAQPRDSRLWTFIARVATQRPVAVVFVMTGILVPWSIVAMRAEPLYDTYAEYPADASFVRGARLYARHFFQTNGISEQTLILSTSARLDTPIALPVLHQTLDRLGATLAERFPIAYQRDLGDPLGTIRTTPKAGPGGSRDRLSGELMSHAARPFYVGRSGKASRLDFGILVEPHSKAAMEMVPAIRAAAQQAVAEAGLASATGSSTVRVDLVGETPLYADMRDLRRRDFRVIAAAAVVLILLILVVVVRSLTQALILIGATLLTYLATYGVTWFLFRQWYGMAGLNWHLNLLLFIVILSLGQDYNIFVVTRITEELRASGPRAAIAAAIRRTGKVVSSCGIIMAATFASMFAGSLLVMKEMAVALAMGILIDTFLIRPLLVPSLILLLYRSRQVAGDEPAMGGLPAPAGVPQT